MAVFDITVGVVSIGLAVFAIWLAFRLHTMAEAAAAKMQEAERVIQRNVEQLDRLFNLLYRDTWTLVRDSYTSMQDRLWEGAGRRADPSDPSNRPPTRTTEDTRLPKERADTGVEEFLLTAYQQLHQTGQVVRAEDLTRLAERVGFSTAEALEALYEITFVRHRLFLAGNQFMPQAILADTPERALEIRQHAQREMIEQLSSELEPGEGGANG
jgi:hypothetical protein